MSQLHGRDSQKAQDAAEELKHHIYLRDQEKTPSQLAPDKRRQLKAPRKKLAKDAAALDAAEEALAQAHDTFAEAETRLEDTVRQVDTLEEELQYLEEQYLRPHAEAGPHRDLIAERAQESLDQAILEAGGQDDESAELQQLSNRIQELLDKRAAKPRKKKKKTRWEQEDMDDQTLPAVPDEPDGENLLDARLDADIDEIDMGQGKQYGTQYSNPNSNQKTSEKILAQHSSRATREFLHAKGQSNNGPYAKATGKGGNKGAQNTSPAPAWGKGPAPAEAHGPLKRPGLQSPDGGEGGGGTATPDLEEPPQAREATSRNQGGMGISSRDCSSPQVHSPPENTLPLPPPPPASSEYEHVNSGDPLSQRHSPPAQGTSSLPAQGPSQLPAQGQASGRRQTWDYTLHTLMNINAWSTFEHKLDDSNFVEAAGYTTILLIQEHKMLTRDEVDAAVAHCARRGFSATFGLAKALGSGKPSGGVGILIKEGLNVGITRSTSTMANWLIGSWLFQSNFLELQRTR